MTHRLVAPPGWGSSSFVVVIPAKDEAARLGCALSGLARDGDDPDVLVVANGCADATARVARSFGALRVAVIETGPLPGGVGEARRIGMQAALEAAPRTDVLATTDADCVVAPGWTRVTRMALDRADVACGRIVPDADEFARLSDVVRRHGALEDALAALTATLHGLRHPAPHDPPPRHGQSPGASLAFRPEVSRRAGGFEPIPCHEDRRIVARIEAGGGRVARPWALAVVASCRLRGRAPGGMADTIARRAGAESILLDEIARMTRHAAALRDAIAAHHAASSTPVSRKRTMRDMRCAAEGSVASVHGSRRRSHRRSPASPRESS
jgi:hypothetical protein